MRLLFFGIGFLSLVGSLHAQSITPVGDAATLEVATWNIEWFGDPNNGPSNDALQLDNVKAVILNAGIDLWAVEEIADQADFNTLMTSLGADFEGILATNSTQQRIGFVYNKNVVQLRQVTHILESFETTFASRPPLQIEADITLPDTSLIVTFIVLHMKAFSDLDSYGRRVDASIRLKNHIDFSSLNSKPVIVLGDWNDKLIGSTASGQTSPYQNFLDDDADYFFVSLPLEQSGAGSFCSNVSCTSTGSMLDHILITDELFDAYVTASAGFIPGLTDAISSYAATTSDHLPVYARFDFSQPEAMARARDAPPGYFSIDPLYPNPASQSSELAFTLDRPANVLIEVYDALGRAVRLVSNRYRPAGRYLERIALDSLPAGLYLVRVSVDGHQTAMPFIKSWAIGDP